MKLQVTQSVSIELNTVVATKQKFPYQAYLQDKFIIGIAGSSSSVGVISGTSNLLFSIQFNASSSGGLFLTLCDNNGNEFIQNLPVLETMSTQYVDLTAGPTLRYTAVNGDGYFSFYPRKVVWEKSFVLDPALVLSAGNCLSFNIFFLDTVTVQYTKNIFQYIVNYQLVSIKVTQQQKQYFFPDQPNLRDVKIQSMHVYFASTIPVNDDNVAVLPFTLTSASNVFLTIVKGTKLVHRQLNMALLSNMVNKETYYNIGGCTFLNNMEMDFDQSYVEFPQGTAFPAVPFTFVFGVFYIKKNQIR